LDVHSHAGNVALDIYMWFVAASPRSSRFNSPRATFKQRTTSSPTSGVMKGRQTAKAEPKKGEPLCGLVTITTCSSLANSHYAPPAWLPRAYRDGEVARCMPPAVHSGE